MGYVCVGPSLFGYAENQTAFDAFYHGKVFTKKWWKNFFIEKYPAFRFLFHRKKVTQTCICWNLYSASHEPFALSHYTLQELKFEGVVGSTIESDPCLTTYNHTWSNCNEPGFSFFFFGREWTWLDTAPTLGQFKAY